MALIDIGANLLDGMFQGEYHGKKAHDPDLGAVLERAKAAGVSQIIVTAGSLSEARQALELVASNDMLFTTVGVHPTRAGEFDEHKDGAEKYLAALLELAVAGQKSGKVVAIGECGLDWDRTQFCSKEVQLKHFEKHFRLAEATRLPMFLHNRNTGGEFARYVREHRSRFSQAVVHSFDGPADELKELLALDLYVGINGASLRTEDNLKTMALIPLDRLMIETDAPWCDIRPTHAGHKFVKSDWTSVKKEKFVPGATVKSRNEPCHIRQVLEVVAGYRGEDIDVVARATHTNACRVFFPRLLTEAAAAKGLAADAKQARSFAQPVQPAAAAGTGAGAGGDGKAKTESKGGKQPQQAKPKQSAQKPAGGADGAAGQRQERKQQPQQPKQQPAQQQQQPRPKVAAVVDAPLQWPVSAASRSAVPLSYFAPSY